MPQINKKTVIVSLLLLTICILIIFFIYSRFVKRTLTNNDAQKETEYAQVTKNEVANKPFLTKLPIRTKNYTIVYGSVDNKIIVIFKNINTSIDDLKLAYSDEINTKLSEIGFDIRDQEISWQIQK